MKRFLCVCMCIFILTISVLTYFPTCVYAADDFTLSTAEGGNISYNESHSAVNNKGDIYNANHEILFRYTPTSDYNWTYVNWDVHCSDAQVVACLRSNNKFEAFGALLKAGVSHNAFSRVMLSELGFLVSKNSEIGTDFLDTITENYNYLNAIEYDSSSGDLTLLADQVSALREDLKKQYYSSIGVSVVKSSGVPLDALNIYRSFYNSIDDYNSELEYFKTVDYAICNTEPSTRDDNHFTMLTTFNKNCDYFYSENSVLYFAKADLSLVEPVYSNSFLPFDFFPDKVTSCTLDHIWPHSNNDGTGNLTMIYKVVFANGYVNNGFFGNGFTSQKFYSKNNKPFLFFKSYEAFYNYVSGSQTAYLSSKVEEAGEDIKLSINDMNDNIGSKIDDLIDSINNKKEGMSADELQKAIDDALASISGKLDDIGDNTQQTNNKLDALLESVSGTNQILMQILGVTTDIRDIVKTKDQEGNQYTMLDVKNCFNTMFNNLKYSILYGKNVTNNPDAANVSTAAYVSYSDVSTADTSAETLDYKDGLLGKFPFSVPYQMYEWLQVLQVDEKVPQFTYNYGFLIGHKGKQEYDLTFDLSKYQPWADVLKSFLRLSFTLIMSVFIYNKFKGEM